MKQFFRGKPTDKRERCARPNCGHSPQAHALINRGTCEGDGDGCRCVVYWFAGKPDPLLEVVQH